MNHLRLILFLIATLLSASAVSLQAESTGDFKNGNFENGLTGWSWESGPGKAQGGVVAQAGLDAVTVFQIVQAGEGEARLSQTVSGLIPGAGYCLTAWVKGRDCSQSWAQGGVQRVSLPSGTFDWTKVEVMFWPDASRQTPVVFGVDGKTAELWISKVSVSAATVVPSGKNAVTLDTARTRLASLEKQAETFSTTDDLTRAGLAVARRYLLRVETGGPNGSQGLRNAKPGDREVMHWTQLQLQETAWVLDQLENRLTALASGRIKPYRKPSLAGGRISYDRGGFWFATSGGERQPVVLGGYGFFNQVLLDMDFLKETGMTFIQQEKGPNNLTREGTLSPTALNITQVIGKAEQAGIFTDVLLSPHYFPSWVVKVHPEVLLDPKMGGFIKFNIDHPSARSALEQWIRTFVPEISKQPGVWSICLSNEASYTNSGRDPYSFPKWIAYLQKKHGTIAMLNARYGTNYRELSEVPVPETIYPSRTELIAPYYDWVRFNQENFAEWHRWMNGFVKELAPNLATHAKLVPDVFDTRPQGQRTHGGRVFHGVDPELITEFTDLAGCDSWSFITPESNESYTWLRTQLWYDLLNSFQQRPVIDSELHFIHDRHPAESIPPGHFYTVLWQGALHHRTAFVNWIWSEPVGASSQGCITLRPANVYASARAMIDLNRLAPEVRAINEAPADVALLYSMTSLIWEEDYPAVIKNIYGLLTQLGCKVTFVSERQLAAGKIPSAKLVILPHATHVVEGTASILDRLQREGTIDLLPVGSGNLAFDEYGKPASVVPKLPDSLRLGGVDARTDLEVLAVALGNRLTAPALIDSRTGKRALGADYRVINYKGRQLVSIINLLHRPMILKVATEGVATDLIGGGVVKLDQITAAAREPILLRIDKGEKSK
ncbi:MAG: hypothetical protein B9S32_00745 [Verrucomicrobia bacterium Tous-C9LFEB]|nr:MAG: hypothetical protein B9S32_00745 [Verrucomicrobia bacterium Tous-C9LFEB]